jgi:ABC-type transport system involved in multi-copper enzyme maturation permease subunit
MASRSALTILVRDELLGYAKSKVMLVLWFLMPAISILGYLALPSSVKSEFGLPFEVTATMYMSVLTSTLGGLIAAIRVAVDIVGERNRKVYDLFVIRPMRRETIMWSKFIAVFVCVSVACIIAVTAGLAVDVARGDAPTGAMLQDLARSLATLAGVIALSAATGVFFGVLSRSSIVAAVILAFQLVQFFQLLPLLPAFLGVLPRQFWIMMLISFGVAALLVHAAAVMFRRAEL